jgi:hypothetical protein
LPKDRWQKVCRSRRNRFRKNGTWLLKRWFRNLLTPCLAELQRSSLLEVGILITRDEGFHHFFVPGIYFLVIKLIDRGRISRCPLRGNYLFPWLYLYLSLLSLLSLLSVSFKISFPLCTFQGWPKRTKG